jgi:signal transduction histidine kinase
MESAMAVEKSSVSGAIVEAQRQLDQALSELERLPAVDPKVISFGTHALNNFLTVSSGTIELLHEALADHPNRQIHAWLQGLDHAIDLMSHAVSRMSNATGQEMALRIVPAELAVLARRVSNYYRRCADLKQIEIRYEADPKVPAVMADVVAAAAVLDNLMSNAVKYSPPGKRITVRVRADGNTAVCSVQDEGPGLCEADQEKLFQPGVRLSPTPTAGENSTGFGLALAKALIERMGGSIWCESAPGRGSTFSFRLPAARV